jgi:hypothetical protein
MDCMCVSSPASEDEAACLYLPRTAPQLLYYTRYIRPKLVQPSVAWRGVAHVHSHFISMPKTRTRAPTLPPPASPFHVANHPSIQPTPTSPLLAQPSTSHRSARDRHRQRKYRQAQASLASPRLPTPPQSLFPELGQTLRLTGDMGRRVLFFFTVCAVRACWVGEGAGRCDWAVSE